MKLIGYTCVYNEEGMIPYVMPYVERVGYDKFIVYDNNSTDRTVELLSQYPFVEIRHYNTNGNFDEAAKRDIEINGYVECFQMAKVNQPDEELIWMTFTDFDEVLFYGGRDTFKCTLNYYYKMFNFNCFCGHMVELLPEDITKCNKPLLHMEDNMKCKWWGAEGNKPTMFAVNDIYSGVFTYGNHWISDIECRQPLKDIKSHGDFHCFHLKWISKDILKNKLNCYYERGGEGYGAARDNLDIMYENVHSVGFPISMYFALKIFDIQKEEVGGMYEKQDN